MSLKPVSLVAFPVSLSGINERRLEMHAIRLTLPSVRSGSPKSLEINKINFLFFRIIKICFESFRASTTFEFKMNSKL